MLRNGKFVAKINAKRVDFLLFIDGFGHFVALERPFWPFFGLGKAVFLPFYKLFMPVGSSDKG